MSVKAIMLLAAMGLLSALPLASQAHHSHGNYDVRNYTHIEGTVLAVIWLNPHIWLHIETEEGETWALEGGSIQAVANGGGWSEGEISSGNRLSARCHAQRDGSNGCLLGYITLEGEEERVFD
jgi:hypothetical protein|tara:strand:+ start:26258 stop:26626 length:369 start_codon:yes stop_codon:yes gene_type:complete